MELALQSYSGLILTSAEYRAPMGGVQASRPFQRVATDILELPMTSKCNRFVLVVEDYFTKFINLYALHNQTAQSVAQCLFDDYVLLHGIPEVLHSDQGRQFDSEIVQRLCQLLEIKKTCTAPYNPKSDSMVEHFNQTLISQLAKALLAAGGEWDDYLKSVAFAYNTSVHASNNYTPYYLVHGHETRVPVDVLVPAQQGRCVFSSQGDYVSSLEEKLETAFKVLDDPAPVPERKRSCTMMERLVTDRMLSGIWSGSLTPRRTG